MILNCLSRVLRAPLVSDGGVGGSEQPQQLNADQQKIAAALEKSGESQQQQQQEPQVAEQPKTGRPRIVKPQFGGPPPEALKGEFNVEDELLEEQPKKIEISNANKDNTRSVEDKVEDDDNKTNKVEDKKPAVAATTQKKDSITATGMVRLEDAKPTTKSQPLQRDYTGFNETQQSVLKQMSNPAFEFASKIIRENEQFKQQKPDSYLQHPQAFVLSPEFQQLNEQLTTVSFEANHWKEQLKQIRAGKQWLPLRGYDDKGNPVYGEGRKPTEDDEIEVSNAMNVAMGMARETQTKAQQLQTTFKQKIDTDTAAIQAESARRFEWVNKPEMMEQKIVIPEVGERTIKQLASDFRSLFPRYHHGTPVMGVAENLFIALQIYGARIRELEANDQQNQRLQKQVLKAEPNIDTNGAVTKGSSSKDFVFDGEPM